MRFAVAALCVLALTGSAGARELLYGTDPCEVVPPKGLKETSVRYETYNLSQRELDRLCFADKRTIPAGAHMGGCTYPAKNGFWQVLVLNTLTLEQIACVVRYETAHMPPNYWADPKMELPETMAWLAEQKAAYLKGQTSP